MPQVLSSERDSLHKQARNGHDIIHERAIFNPQRALRARKDLSSNNRHLYLYIDCLAELELRGKVVSSTYSDYSKQNTLRKLRFELSS